MLSRDEVQATVQRLTMPEWLHPAWTVFDTNNPNRFKINATMYVPDRDTGDMLHVNYDRIVDLTDSPAPHATVLIEARKLLYYLAMHEVNEHLLLDGKRWVDVHVEGDPIESTVA